MLKVKLKIHDEKSKNRFIFWLPLYKSFAFKIFDWNIDTPYEDINKIVLALNIKGRKKRITFIFDEACRQIDEHFRDIENPCGFVNARCYSQRCRGVEDTNGCCRLCKYQSNSGCPTKNLACKLFFCTEVRKRHEIIEFKDIKILRLLSLRQQMLVKSDYFSKREDVINDLFYGSLVIGVIRIYFRFIPQIVKIQKKS